MEHGEEFLNRTQGWIGVVKIDRKGDEKPDTVAAGERVFLTKDEQILTERAHSRPQDSPFVERHIVHYDQLTGEVIAEFDAPLLEKVQPEAAGPKAQPKRETSSRRRAAQPVAG